MEYINERPTAGRRFHPAILLAVLLLVLWAARWGAGMVIDYQWWQEMGQVSTWIEYLLYGTLPAVAAGVVLFVLLWVTHARAVKRAGSTLRRHPVYARLTTLGLLALSALMAAALVDSWTVVRWAGAHAAATSADSWRDPVFGRTLAFYFFDMPFYELLLGLVLAAAALTAVVYWITVRGWQLRNELPNWSAGEGIDFDLRDLRLGSAFEFRFLRILGSLFLATLAVRFFLNRYGLLFADRGSLVGVDWVAENVTLPLLWLCTAAALAAAVAVGAGRLRWALVLPAVFVLYTAAPPLVHAVYVRPSEVTIQKPFIARHIEATRTAYRLNEKVQELDFNATIDAPVDATQHKPLLDNVRLWDWQAFHDTVTQIQALRPYYAFADSDVDRYKIDGQLRQLLLTPRELDVRQLPGDARSRWINPHFIYTHGYGLVVAEANRITPDGSPVLLVKNAPPEINTKSLQLTRPELYYGEVTHEPVFVRTKQPEFNYPSGASNVESRYEGKGGFPVASPLIRLAATLSTGDWNILLTSYLDAESRMMIRRKVRERLAALAGFLLWDNDPYLVLTPEGRLVWMVDGYTTSDAHPYSRGLNVTGAGRVNYIRNSVKATVDAYDGTTHLYVFDERDPVLAAYRNLFPKLFTAAAQMPAALREHARYPELIFRVQAEIYRLFHMRDPEAFFNNEDMWDVSRSGRGQEGQAETMTPTYIVATMPDGSEPEFLLMTTFTPRAKDNLIGIMLARCDGEHLGELVFLLLSKQELVYGPLQVEAKINQDQNISKDLTLWNQQGSRVIRGQMLVLPIEKTVLYVQPIYIQSSQARMPQLKKVALAHGNQIWYTDSYEEAVAELTRARGASPARAAPAAVAASGAAAPPVALRDPQMDEARDRIARYRSLMSQGKYAEAGRELEALERILSSKK